MRSRRRAARQFQPRNDQLEFMAMVSALTPGVFLNPPFPHHLRTQA